LSTPEINMKVLPPVTQKVAAALQVLDYLREQQEPSFTISGQENPEIMSLPAKVLDPQEKALKSACLTYLVHYFHGEMD
tara:strand:+ start:630 stop:866 length:237 start_codon:yes stop_codon:yes gene_type:complete